MAHGAGAGAKIRDKGGAAEPKTIILAPQHWLLHWSSLMYTVQCTLYSTLIGNFLSRNLNVTTSVLFIDKFSQVFGAVSTVFGMPYNRWQVFTHELVSNQLAILHLVRIRYAVFQFSSMIW